MTNLLNLFQQMDTPEKEVRNYKKCPLNYTGSKRQSLDAILSLLPYSNTWVDVFGGSGIVTICRKPSKLDVFNDRQSGICDFYRAIQNDYKRLIEIIELMPHSRELFQRLTKENHDDYVVRGANWYYLVQCSFAGRAQFFGRTTTGSNSILNKLYGNLKLFPEIHRRFKKVTIENLDWKQCFKDYDSYETVFYCDPPYLGSDIYEHSVDHKDLCERIFELKGFVALSGFDNDLYNSFPWDGKHVLELGNSVSAAFDTRESKRLECLWIKEMK